MTSNATVYRVVKSQDYATIATFHLRDKRLTLAAKGLMSILLGDEGDGAYTVAQLVEQGPEGRDAIRSALRRLEECGYIHRRQTHDSGGRFASTEMLIYESPWTENPSTVEPSTAKPSTENPSTVEPEPEFELNQGLSLIPERPSKRERENKEEIKNPPTNPPGCRPKWKPERFDAFWAFYRKNCRGESRQAAVRAWDKLKPDDATIEAIGHALQRQLRSELWQRGVGIPYASTYLNQRRWEDDIGPHVPTASPELTEPEDVRYWTPEVAI